MARGHFLLYSCISSACSVNRGRMGKWPTRPRSAVSASTDNSLPLVGFSSQKPKFPKAQAVSNIRTMGCNCLACETTKSVWWCPCRSVSASGVKKAFVCPLRSVWPAYCSRCAGPAGWDTARIRPGRVQGHISGQGHHWGGGAESAGAPWWQVLGPHLSYFWAAGFHFLPSPFESRVLFSKLFGLTLVSSSSAFSICFLQFSIVLRSSTIPI